MNKSDEKTDVAKVTVSDISIDMLLNIHDNLLLSKCERSAQVLDL